MKGFRHFWMFVTFSLCNGMAIISPSGTMTGLDGERRTINCSFPDASGSATILYDEKLSNTVFVAPDHVTQISISPFKGTAIGLGLSTVQGVQTMSFRLTFTLESEYNGAYLRCHFMASDSTMTSSQPVTLVVLCTSRSKVDESLYAFSLSICSVSLLQCFEREPYCSQRYKPSSSSKLRGNYQSSRKSASKYQLD